MYEDLIVTHRDLALTGREMELAGLSLVLNAVPSTLYSRCQQYWMGYRHLNSCFQDLRRFVESLSLAEQKEFHEFISKTTQSSKSELDEGNPVRYSFPIPPVTINTYSSYGVCSRSGFRLK